MDRESTLLCSTVGRRIVSANSKMIRFKIENKKNKNRNSLKTHFFGFGGVNWLAIQIGALSFARGIHEIHCWIECHTEL